MKMLFYTISLFLIVFSSSWISLWMTFEFNMVILILLMFNSNNFEMIVKYFLIQSINTLVLIMIFLLMKQSLLIFFLMCIKLAFPPFHVWFIDMMKSLSFQNLFIMLTLQKLPFLILLTTLMSNFKIFLFLLFFATAISTFMGIIFSLTYYILMFSSFNHMCWMTLAQFISYNLFLQYFLIYSLMLLSFILMMNLKEMKTIMNLPIMILLLLIVISGIPPFPIFLYKWSIITFFCNKLEILMFFMLFMMILSIFFYFRLVFYSFTKIWYYSKFNSLVWTSMLTTLLWF